MEIRDIDTPSPMCWCGGAGTVAITSPYDWSPTEAVHLCSRCATIRQTVTNARDFAQARISWNWLPPGAIVGIEPCRGRLVTDSDCQVRGAAVVLPAFRLFGHAAYAECIVDGKLAAVPTTQLQRSGVTLNHNHPAVNWLAPDKRAQWLTALGVSHF